MGRCREKKKFFVRFSMWKRQHTLYTTTHSQQANSNKLRDTKAAVTINYGNYAGTQLYKIHITYVLILGSYNKSYVVQLHLIM